MKFIKIETVQPDKVSVKTVDGKETKEKVKVEVEAGQYDSVTEFVNSQGGETSALATINQKNAQAAATAFRIAYNQAIENKKTEDEALSIGRAEAKKARLSVRGPSKKELDAQKDKDFAEVMAAALSGKLSRSHAEEVAAKYGFTL